MIHKHVRSDSGKFFNIMMMMLFLSVFPALGQTALNATGTLTPASVSPGDTSSFVLTLAKTGGGTVTGGAATVTFTGPGASLPLFTANPVVTAATGCTISSATFSGSQLTLTGINMTAAGGSQCIVTAPVSAQAVGVYTATIAVQNYGGLLAGTISSPTLTVTFPTITLTKSFSPASIVQGGTSTVTLTAARDEVSGSTTGITFTDLLPANLTANWALLVNSCGGTVDSATGQTFQISNVTLGPNAATCEVSFPVTSTVPGSYPNSITNFSATSEVLSFDTSNASATLTVTTAPPPTITFTKSFTPASVSQSDTSTVAISISRSSEFGSTTGLAFTDILPTDLNADWNTLVNGCGGSVNSATGQVLQIGGISLGPNAASCQVTFNVSSAQTGTYINTLSDITASSTVSAFDTTQASATLTVTDGPTVNFEKLFSASSIDLNGTTILTVRLTRNNVGGPATAVGVTDILPAGLTFAGLANPVCATGAQAGTAAVSGNTLTLSGFTLNDQNSTCNITITVVGNNAGNYTNTLTEATVANGINNLINDGQAMLTVVDPTPPPPPPPPPSSAVDVPTLGEWAMLGLMGLLVLLALRQLRRAAGFPA